MRVLRGSDETKIRFACVDVPEMDEVWGLESRDYLRELLSSAENEVQLEITNIDRYGRTVAEVWIESDGGLERVRLLQINPKNTSCQFFNIN